MNGNLVDTNVIIRVLKGQTELFPLFDDMENLFVSSITAGELMYGAALSKMKDDNTENYLSFCRQMNVIVPDIEVSKMYGKIKAQLKADGKPIPENDIWIAATAMAGNLTLLTEDKDFLNVEELSLKII